MSDLRLRQKKETAEETGKKYYIVGFLLGEGSTNVQLFYFLTQKVISVYLKACTTEALCVPF